MYQVIIVIHVLLGLGIIGLILIQQGKGADAGATFGAGASGSVFGAQGAASFLSRTTATMAAMFFITSLGLAILNGKQGAAYDLMNAPTANNSAGIPYGETEKTAGSAPAKVTDSRPEEIPETPSAASTVEAPVVNTVPPVNSEETKKEIKLDVINDKPPVPSEKQVEKK